MEKPTYNPARAREMQEFLSNCNPMELRWLHFAADKELERRVAELDRVRDEASNARFQFDLQWTADGQLQSKNVTEYLAEKDAALMAEAKAS